MHLIHEYGLIAVAAIVALECLGLPVPGEAALLSAAVYAGTKHDLNIVGVILTAAGAAIVGRMIGYVIGREFGYRLLLRYGSYVGLTTGGIKLGQYLFLRYGGKIIFAAQFVPVLRTFTGPFAGANVMPWRDFLLANAVSSSVWAASYGLAAYWAGREFEQLQGSGRLARGHRRVGRRRGHNLCAPARGSTDRASRARDARPAEVALGSRLLPFHADGQRTAASESRNVGLTAHRSSGRLLCRFAHAVSLRLLK
jgi:membrane protein DedA with SNARE-associated domain